MKNEKQIKKAMQEALSHLFSNLNLDVVPERKKYLLTFDNFKIIITGASRFCSKPSIFYDGQEGCFLSFVGKNVGKVQESSNLVPHGFVPHYDQILNVS